MADTLKAEAAFGKDRCQAKTLSRHNLPILKAMCSARALSTEGTKAVLAARLMDWVSTLPLILESSRSHSSCHDQKNALASTLPALRPPTLSAVPSLFRMDVAPGPALSVADANPENVAIPPPHDHQPEAPVAADNPPTDLPAHPPPEQHPPPKQRIPSGYVLGKETLGAIHVDIRKTELPSWVNRAPQGLGKKSQGKLGADEWRTACTVHFPITLIRLWGQDEGWKRKMLNNFMNLVTAVEVGGSLVMTDELISVYNDSLTRYLKDLKDLYRETSIKPNHHLAMHIGLDVMPSYGPLHPIRAFSTERNNFMLQSENTNQKFGKNVPIGIDG